MKRLVLNRNELVWERYETAWTDKDWEDFVRSTKARIEKEGQEQDSWLEYQKDLYELIKDLTWEDVIADFNKYEENWEDEENCLYVVRHSLYKREDGSVEDYSYKDFLHDIIKEEMQDELYACGPYDTGDVYDCDEDFTVEEVREDK